MIKCAECGRALVGKGECWNCIDLNRRLRGRGYLTHVGLPLTGEQLVDRGSRIDTRHPQDQPDEIR